MAAPQILNRFLHTQKHQTHEDMRECASWSDLGGDLVLVKVGEVLEFGEDIFCGGKGFRLAALPLLSFLSSCARGKERGERKKKSKIRAGAATHNWSAVFFPVCRTGQPWNRVKPAVCSRISSLLWFEAPAQKTLLWGHFREKENCTFHLRATENFELKVISSSRGCDKVTQYVIMTLKGLPRLNKVTCMRDKVAVNWWALLA